MLAKSRGLALGSPARALELDAIAQIKAQQSGKHWLATHFTSNPRLVPASTLSGQIETFAQLDSGFTFFIRVVYNGLVLWEGDVNRTISANINLDLSRFWSDVSKSWYAMRDFLSVLGAPPTDPDPEHREHYTVLRQLEFIIVTVRELDQAKFCLGRFAFNEDIGSEGEPEGYYLFHPAGRHTHLQSCCEEKYYTQFNLLLVTMHDPDAGRVVRLKICIDIHSRHNTDVVPAFDIIHVTNVFNELADRIHYALGLDYQEYARTGTVVSHPLPAGLVRVWTEQAWF